MVATFLRAHIGEVFVSHLVLIAPYELAAVAVPIVLVRTTTVVLYPIILLGHLQLHAITEQPLVLGLALGL